MGKPFQFLLPWALLTGLSLQAQPQPATVSTNRTPIFSSSRLFHVAGGSSVENLQMAGFADKVQEAVADKLGGSVPRFSGNPILLTLRTQEEQRTRIERFQRCEGRALYQEVLIMNPVQADQEHLLEALTWCLLNRYAMTRQPGHRREQNPVQCPEWLSTGLAQSLFPLSRNRNRQLVSGIFSRQAFHSAGDILTWIRLPDHRPLTHAECEFQYQWLVYEASDFLSSCLQRLSAEQDLGLEWVKDQCGLTSDRQLMMRRDVWMAREVLPYVDLRPYQAEDVRGLQALINLELPLFDLFFDPPAREAESLPDLIRTLPANESRETLRLLERELNKLNMGKSGPLQAWSNSFSGFLRELLSSVEEGTPVNQQGLLRRLQALEQERRQLMEEWLSRDQYLDEFEKRN